MSKLKLEIRRKLAMLLSVVLVLELCPLTPSAYGAQSRSAQTATQSDAEETASDSDAEEVEIELINDLETEEVASDSDAEAEVELENDLASNSDAELIDDLLVEQPLMLTALAAEVPATSISITNKPLSGNLYLSVGDTFQLEVEMEPEDATETYSFTSGNENRVTVTGDGLIEAVSSGSSVKITVESDDTGLSDSIYIYPTSMNVKKVVLYANGGEFSDGSDITYCYYTYGSLELPVPTMEGKAFAGWYSDEECTELLVEKGDSISPTENMELYARWVIPTSSITFLNNPLVGNIYLTIGDTMQLEFRYEPEDAEEEYYFDPRGFQVTVTEDGLLEAVSTGLVYVYVESDITGCSDRLRIEVMEDATKVALHANGGEFSDGSMVTYIYGYSTYTNSVGLPAPTYKGKLFTGWYSDEKCTDFVTAESTICPTETMDLYAGWDDGYTITYDCNGGTYNGESQYSVVIEEGGEIGSSYITPTSPSSSQAFGGWMTEEGTIYENSELSSYVPTGDETLTAVWVLYYTITFDFDGGSAIINHGPYNTYYYSWTAQIEAGEAIGGSLSVSPDKTGMYLAGWQTESGDVYTSTQLQSYVPTGDETITAVYESYYVITYDFNGGIYNISTSPKSYNIKQGAQIGSSKVSSTVVFPPSDDVIFAGWQTESGDIYSDSELYYYTPSGSETITAVWSAYYTVTYNFNGGLYGTIEEYSFKIVQGEEIGDSYVYVNSITAPSTTVYLYGWETESGEVYTNSELSSYVPTSNETLKAVWDAYYVITYDCNGGTTTASKTVYMIQPGNKIGSSRVYSYTLTAPSDERYFVGWQLENGDTYTESELYYYVPEGDETITAVWGINYTITYDLNGGSYNGSTDQLVYYVKSGNNISYQYPSSSIITAPSDDAIFAGWKSENGDVYTSLSSYIPEGDETFTAVWGTPCKITFNLDGGWYNGSADDQVYTIVSGNSINSSYPYESYLTAPDGRTFWGWETEDETVYPGSQIRNYVPEHDETITAYWVAGYRVTFDLNGGTYSGSTDDLIYSFLVGESIGYSCPSSSLITAPSSSVEFGGWLSESGDIYTDLYSYVPESNETFTAVWNTLYKIAYRTEGASGSTTIKTYTISAGDSIGYSYPSSSSVIAESDYVILAGWRSKDGTVYTVSELRNHVPEGDETFTAVWSAYYSITYDMNGGTYYGGVSTKVYKVAEGNSIESQYPSSGLITGPSDDVECIGWKSEGGTVYTVSELMDYVPEGDETFTVVWGVVYDNTYKITYDLNGGTYSSSTDDRVYTITMGDSIGYSYPSSSYITASSEKVYFDGWKDESGTIYTESELKAYVPTSNKTFTAVWSACYKITFDLNGALYDESTDDVVYYVVPGKSLSSSSAYPTRLTTASGLKHTAWKSESGEYNTSASGIGARVPEGDETFTAVLRESCYITFDMNGGTYYNASTYVSEIVTGYTVLSPVKVDKITPPSVGMLFSGWMSESGDIYENIYGYVTTGDETFTAVWVRGYAVTYDLNGGVYLDSADNPAYSIEIGAAIDTSYPASAGMIAPSIYMSFGGWLSGSGDVFTESDLVEYVPTEDVMFTAIWLGSSTDLTYASVAVNGTYTYTGEQIIPELAVRIGSTALEEGTDYTVSYGENINAGTGTVTITAVEDSSYTGSQVVEFTIGKAELDVSVPGGTYTATYLDSLSTVVLPDGWAWANPDSTVGSVGSHSYAAVYAAEDSTNYNDKEASVTVTVTAYSIEGAEVTLKENTFTYTGEEIEPEISSVKVDSITLTTDDYTVGYGDNVNAGNAAYVTVSGTGNFTGTVTVTFTIEAADPELVIGNQVYEAVYGQQLKDIELPAGWSWQEPETAVGSVTGSGSRTFPADYDSTSADSNYADKTGVSLKVRVTARSIKLAEAVLEKDYYYYDNEAITPAVTVTDTILGEGMTLAESTDYSITYANNNAVGTAMVTVEGTGNYTDKVTLTFRILDDPYSLAGAVITLDPASAAYTGEAITPAVTVTLGGVQLTEDTDYTVAYTDNVNPGYGKVTITGTGTKGTETYYGTATKTFYIGADNYELTAVYSAQLKEVTLPDGWSWQEPECFVGDVTGESQGNAFLADYTDGDEAIEDVTFYVIVTEKDLEDQTVTIEIGKDGFVYNPESAAQPTVQITDAKTGETLVKGTDYLVSYRNNNSAGEAFLTISGIGNYKGSVTESFEIEQAESSVAITSDKVTESGDGSMPTMYLTIKDEPFFLYVSYAGDGTLSVVSSDSSIFEAEVTENEYGETDGQIRVAALGEAELTVTVSETTNYKGSEMTFRVVVSPVELTQDEVTLETGTWTYTGSQITPSVSVSYQGETLTVGTDYTVSYGSNVNAGENAGTVTVTGRGDYTGSVTVTFDIKKAENPAEAPEAVTATYGQTLEEISLSGDWTWSAPETLVGSVGEHSYEAYLAETDNYQAKTADVTVTVEPKFVELSMLELEYEETEYDGTAKEPSVTMTYGGVTLSADDYTVEYTANTEPGTAFVTVSGRNNFTGTLAKAFTISKATLRENNVTVEGTWTYDGTGKYPEPVVTVNGTILTKDVDYEVSYGENIHAGEDAGSVTVTGIGAHYTGEVTVTFAIGQAENPATPSNAEYTATYGDTLADSEPDLPDGWAWVSPDTAVGNVGTNEHEAVLAATQDYLAKIVTMYVTVAEKQLTDSMVTVDAKSIIYNGTEQKPAVTVADESGITADDYEVTYSNNIHAGTGTVTVTAKGNYTGTVTKSFVIRKAIPSLTVESSTSVTKTLGEETFSLGAALSVEGEISYASSNPDVASVDEEGTVTILAVGSTALTVSFAGDDDHEAVTVRIYLTVQEESETPDDGSETPDTGDSGAGTGTDGSGSGETGDGGSGSGSGDGSSSNTGGNQTNGNTTGSRDSDDDDDDDSSSGGSSSGGSGGSGSGSSGMSGTGSAQYTSLPAGYTGGTKVIGNVEVPSYVEQGNWRQMENGTWSLSGDDGTAVIGRWIAAYNPYADLSRGQSAFDWFRFDHNGLMLTGWFTDTDGEVYYLNPLPDNTQGRMVTGWHIIDGLEYYFSEAEGERGRLLRNRKTPDGYEVDEFGVKKKEED